jgi:mono/diheme cytochrome c family protein
MRFTPEKNGGMKISGRVRAAAVAWLAAGLAFTAFAEEESPAPTRTAADGVFSEAQIARGRRGYNALCARCHGETLGGGEDSPPLVGASFFKGWAGKTLGELIEYTRVEMPSDGPGKVTRKQSTDITSFVLSMNGFPVGPTELAPNLADLEKITIPSKK